MNHYSLSHKEARSVIALCTGVALLIAVAVFLSGSATNTIFFPSSSAAATVLGDAQGVPPGFTDQTYPDYTSCWIVLDGKFGYRGPHCPGAGASNWAPAYTFFSGIFSLNPTGSANGKSVYIRSTWVDTGFQQGPLLGPPFSTLGCPDGTLMTVTASDPDTGAPTSGECYSGGAVAGGDNGGGFNGRNPTYAGPATYCYTDSGDGGPKTGGFGGGGGGPPSTYSFPPGYSTANGDKLDTYGGARDGAAFTGRNGGDGQCYAWKYTLQHIDSAPASIGAVPTVAPGTPLTLQWSCLPSRQVEVGYCHYDQWNSHCWKNSYVLYKVNPLASSVSGSGQNFVPGTSITDTKTITAPAAAGTYTYSLSCGGGQYPLPAMTVDVTVSGEPATPQLSLAPAASTIPYNSTQTLTYTATGGAGYDACYLSGGQWGNNPGTPVGTSGSVTTNPLTSDKQYSYTCHNIDPTYPNNGWVDPVTANVTVTPQSSCPGAHEVNPPACTCETGYVRQNGACVLPTPQCQGAHEVNPPACTCDTGYVRQNGACVIAPPLTFTAVPSATLPGQAVTLTWNCPNPPYTLSSGDSHYSTGGALSGNTTVNPTNTTTYNLYCKVGNSQSSRSATVTVAQPGLSITAAPARVQKGKTSTVSWTATNVTAGSCRVTGTDGASWAGASGSKTPTINAPVIYTLACAVPSGPVSTTVTVGIVPVFQEI